MLKSRAMELGYVSHHLSLNRGYVSSQYKIVEYLVKED